MAPFEGLFLFFVNYRFENVEIWPLKTNRMGRLFSKFQKNRTWRSSCNNAFYGRWIILQIETDSWSMTNMTSFRRKTILITDVDRNSRESLRDVFEPAGFRTILADSGEEALSLASRYEIHVAVFEMHLPRLTGLETVELARQVRGLWIPTILITSDHNDRLLQRALKARVHCVLGKPVNEPLAIKAVNRILEKFY